MLANSHSFSPRVRRNNDALDLPIFVDLAQGTAEGAGQCRQTGQEGLLMDGSLLRNALLALVAASSPVETAASADLNDNNPGRLAFESMCATCQGANAFHAELGFSGGSSLPDCV